MYKQLNIGATLECYGIKGTVVFNNDTIVKIKWENSGIVTYEGFSSIDRNYKIVK